MPKRLREADLLDAANRAASLAAELITAARFARGDLNPDDPQWVEIHSSMLQISKNVFDRAFAQLGLEEK